VIYIIFCGLSRALLKFQLQQLHVPSLGRYFLPLPKLTDAQLRLLSAHLERRGFGVRLGSGPSKRVALKGAQRIAIDGALGLAASAADVLDALAPAIPPLLSLPRQPSGKARADVAALYFSLKRSGASTELQLFPRLESLRTWSCLRRDGLCGLTPDEAAVLKHFLGRASSSSQLECVTAKPRQGSVAFQVGRRLYYKSTMPVAEFLNSLRTIDSGGADSASYLPRGSVILLPGVRVDTRVPPAELGEWCFVG
jgi:hypothetical protein